MNRWLNNLKYRNFFVSSITLVIATVVYCLGFTYIYFPIALVYIILLLPLPSIFDSVATRIVPGLLAFFGIYQIIATLQQFFFRHTDFTIVAIILTATLLLIGYVKIYYVDKYDISSKFKIVSSNDIMAILAVSIFVIPFSVFLLKGGDIYQNIAQIGGIQAIDGTNHWNQIYVNSYSESIRYDRNSYFPAGFHIATAFIQDSLGLNPNSVPSWKTNSVIFILQYIVSSVTLIVMSSFFILKLVGERPGRWRKLLIPVALAPSLTVLFVIPFIYNGFLNHIYMCAAIVLAAIILIEWYEQKSRKDTSVRSNLYLLGLYYTVAYGAALSWPLITPPLILAPLLLGIPTISLALFKESLSRNQLIGLVVGSAVLSVPVLIQYFVSPIGPTASILLEGGLKTWHVGIYGVAILVAIWIYTQKSRVLAYRSTVIYMISFLVLVIGLAALQYFSIGEVRYYTIKTSSFIEIFILLMLVVFVVAEVGKSKTLSALAISAIAVPSMMFIAISFNDNPLKDTRSLFRTYSNEQKPPFFDDDTNAMVAIAEQEKTFSSNYMTLHYSFESNKVYTHTQIPFWVSTIRKDVVKGDKATTCLRGVYKVMLFSDFSEKSQRDLISNINQCSNIAKENNHKYYILTDSKSHDTIKTIFSSNTNIDVVVE